jgi:hypothetical protein
MIDAAVAKMCHEAASAVEAEHGQGCSHTWFATCVGSIKALISFVHDLLKTVVGEHGVFNIESADGTSNGSGYCIAGHFATRDAAHTIADDEEAVGSGSLVMKGEECVFLRFSSSYFEY